MSRRPDPVIETAVAGSPGAGASADGPGGSGPLRLLVLEDDPLDAELILELLGREAPGAELRWVSGRDAFEEALADGCDLVLADWSLPGFDGMQALQMVRGRHPRLPFIIVSGSLGEDPAIEALTSGATDYVLKQRLGRLGPSVRRAVAESHERAERQRAEEALQASERRYRFLFDENPSMFFTISPDGVVLAVNRFGAEQLGFRPEELRGRPVSDLHLAEDAPHIEEHLRRCLAASEHPRRWEIRKRRKDGETLWVRESARVLEDADGAPTIVTVCEDTSEARQLSQRLSFQASHDPLTGLVNRREFERRVQRVVDTVNREGGESALCYLDLDQFKVINDTCGHAAGDELLRQVSSIMLRRVRRRDTLARLGGDEFGVLIEHCPMQQARRVANGLGRAIEDFRFVWEDKIFSVGVSIGLVGIDGTLPDISSLMAAADSACYAAKDQGRNRIHVFRPDDAELLRRQGEMQWVSRLHSAIDEGRFRLASQAIVPLNEYVGGGQHFELLLRLQDEQGQIVPPGAFLPAAERYNLSTRIDRWVVEAAFGWLVADPDRLDGIALCSINLSGQSLGDEGFLDFLLQRFDKDQVPPHKLCFEITETAAITQLSNATRFISTLRLRGARFALDDFGSGLSSFAYLKNLPVDYLKIDGMFVKDIETDAIDDAMVRSITEIGKVMGKKIIAEFAENAAIVERLREIGVDFAQGYGLGRPRLLDLPD